MRIIRPMRILDFIAQNKRWLFAGGLISFSSSYGQTFFISVFAGEIMDTFQLTNGEWGGIYTLGTTASALLMLYGGTLSDRFRARTLSAIVLGLLALACLFMAVNSLVWLLPVVIFTLRFTGQGMLSHVSIVSIARWFSAARGKALAISALGFSVGESLLPILFVSLLAVLPWRGLWVLAAGFTVILIPVMLILLKTERTPQSLAESSESLGMNGRHWTRPETIRHWLFWMILPTMTAPAIFSTSLYFQQVHLTATKGWDHAGFVALFPIYSITTILMNFVYGAALDRFGTGRLLAVFQVPMALAYFSFGFGTTLSAAALGFFLMGLMQGGATLWGAFWAEYYGTKHLGAVKSLAMALMVFGSAIGPGITGALIDLGIPFHQQMVYFGVYILCACGLTHIAMRRAMPAIAAA